MALEVMQPRGAGEALSLADGAGSIAMELKTMMVLRLQARFDETMMVLAGEQRRKKYVYFSQAGSRLAEYRRNPSSPPKATATNNQGEQSGVMKVTIFRQ